MQKPETIDNQWDILYRDYPEVYEAFSVVKRRPAINLAKMLHVKDKIVVDVASGTGRSTFDLARYAKKVIGVEPESAMIKIARNTLKKNGFKNVTFLKGSSDRIPLPDRSVDVVVAITSASFFNADNIRRFVQEAERVLIGNGSVYSIDVAPGWYGGDMAPIILGSSRRQKGIDYDVVRDDTFTELGFKHKDFYTIQKYDSIEHIISTYGFIFGKNAIDYLRAHNKTTIKWKNRIYFNTIP
jgi:SAM-dependent methyltransferase